MKLTRLALIAIISGAITAGAAAAQTRPGSVPAEFPPASYKGKQYVDSNGCVFIRAGIDGTVSWVPRVTRKREGVCGFKPTFAGQVTEPAPVQTAAAAAAPQITMPEPVAQSVPQPKAKPPVVEVMVAPEPMPEVVRQVAKSPEPIVEKAVQPVPAPKQTAPVAVAQGTAVCAGASPLSSQYLRSGKHAVRCGPQTGTIVGARISTAPEPRDVVTATQQSGVSTPQRTYISRHARIVPRHVAANRVNTTNVRVPHGYKEVWTDDRLNPKRAEQTLAGYEAMSQIWTSTLPRRLIDQGNTGTPGTSSSTPRHAKIVIVDRDSIYAPRPALKVVYEGR